MPPSKIGKSGQITGKGFVSMDLPQTHNAIDSYHESNSVYLSVSHRKLKCNITLKLKIQNISSKNGCTASTLIKIRSQSF